MQEFLALNGNDVTDHQSGGGAADPTASLRLEVLRDLTIALAREVEALKERNSPDPMRRLNLYKEVRQFEINLIACALARTGGHQTRAAQLLGVKLTTLNAKIKRYGIDMLTIPADSERAA
ncbi:MAG: hypothetical protein M3Q76_13045 [Acidobacteriota bacterium]|nr:hypothetical protein [Acidobacteriota bacterium]